MAANRHLGFLKTGNVIHQQDSRVKMRHRAKFHEDQTIVETRQFNSFFYRTTQLC